MEKIHTYRSDGEVKSWLLSIAYNSFLQFKRKQKSQNNLLEKVGTLCDNDQGYLESQTLPDLHKLLSILSTEAKACMILCYSFSYSHSEISSMLKLPLGTVKSHIKRSTAKISQRFKIEV